MTKLCKICGHAFQAIANIKTCSDKCALENKRERGRIKNRKKRGTQPYETPLKAFVAKWPNGSSTILTANSELDLYDQLDSEGPPETCEIFVLPSRFNLSSKSEIGWESGGPLATEWDSWEFGDGLFIIHKTSPYHDLFGIEKEKTRKLESIRKRKLKINPLQMLGAMKGIKLELTNQNQPSREILQPSTARI